MVLLAPAYNRTAEVTAPALPRAGVAFVADLEET